MKIIDILVKKANGTLEDGFKFKFKDTIYIFKDTTINDIEDENSNIGFRWNLDLHLNDEVEAIKASKEIEGLNAYKLIEGPYMASLLRGNQFDEFMVLLKQSELEIVEKIDELVRAVNKLTKEREVK